MRENLICIKVLLLKPQDNLVLITELTKANVSNAPQQSFINNIIFIVARHNSCEYFDPRAKNGK